MSDPQHMVLTIGHSTHSIEAFLDSLKKHGITAVADVRSTPFSRFNPQFSKGALEQSLRSHGIRYVFLGRELGARSGDPSCYDGGRVQYSKLAQTELFKSGLERVIEGAREYRITLMCAEKDPLECHRTLLVARALTERGVEVAHILPDGRLEPHENTMERLIELVGLPTEDLFRSRQQLLEDALTRQEQRIAYVDEKLAAEASGDGR